MVRGLRCWRTTDGIEITVAGQEVKVDGVARFKGLQGANENLGFVLAVFGACIQQVEENDRRGWWGLRNRLSVAWLEKSDLLQLTVVKNFEIGAGQGSNCMAVGVEGRDI
jgi:hypothetical protein